MQKINLKWLEWAGCITGVAGALMLALNNAYSGWGFVLFLLSNFCWISFGIASKTHGLTTMQIAYTITSVVGIYRWLFA